MDLDPGFNELRRQAAREISRRLDLVAPGESFSVALSDDLCDILDFYIPAALRKQRPEWLTEGIDGFCVSRATKKGELGLEMAGMCILITDQTVTPFLFDFEVTGQDQFTSVRLRIGEDGSGPLGISGPKCTSPRAKQMIATFNDRVATIDWVYDVSVGDDH